MTASGSIETVFHQSSTGQARAETAWLDTHFEACRPEYEAIVRSVGFEPGWDILDAGCGSGNFVPALLDLVGPHGYVVALDSAPENVALVEQRIAGWRLSSRASTVIGSIFDMPYPSRTFDAVWCANTSQSFNDEQLLAALREFRRVVRPGGLVVMMEFDFSLYRKLPIDPFRFWRLWDALIRTDHPFATIVRNCLRAGNLRFWLQQAGLVDVAQRTAPIERWSPLGAAETAYMSQAVMSWPDLAEAADISSEDRDDWLRLRDPDMVRSMFDDPAFHWCESNVVAVGRVPDEPVTLGGIDATASEPARAGSREDGVKAP